MVLSNDMNRSIRRKGKKDAGHNQTASGTATVIYAAPPKVAFLTCAHIVDHPDTIYSFFESEKGEATDYVQRVSFKLRQDDYITGFRDGGHLEILKMDRKNDIAVMGIEIKDEDRRVPVFDFKSGNTSDLEWGSFVYVIGYPLGFQMITRGIVSKPQLNERGAFLIDALFNRGISGGLILAVRDGVPNFELVGMARSVSAKHEYVLRPEKEGDEYSYDPYIPYEGRMYVHTRSNIHYGITHAISIETIRQFFRENLSFFADHGFYFESILK